MLNAEAELDIAILFKIRVSVKRTPHIHTNTYRLRLESGVKEDNVAWDS